MHVHMHPPLSLLMEGEHCL